ncbi:MAG TPA: hypothetical protein VFA55_10265 [Candidatus Kapabacteria bacterium]|nr:hypothetical protein [Candidatus Kapabacteria bacterium]
MKQFKYLFLVLSLPAAMATFGFACSKTPDNSFFVLKRFSSIPPIVRSTVFSQDCTVSIHDPINTDNPFTFTMTSGECDSLKTFCEGYESYDSVYNDTTMHIPNPSSIVMEFHANGTVKTVRIIQFPKIANGLIPLLECASSIEQRGLDMMKKQEMDKIRAQKEQGKLEGK